MRLPGLAWLEFSLQAAGGSTMLRQRALFYPRGLAGQAYWKGIAPFHGIVFGSMIRNIAAAAEGAARIREASGSDGTGHRWSTASA